MDTQDEPNLAGMTVNERLFCVGILNQWDAAIERRDRRNMIAMLERVQVSDPHLTVDAILAAPGACSV